MALLSLIQYLNRKKDLAYQTDQSIREIEARKRNEIEAQRGMLEEQNRIDDIRKVTDEKEMMENLYHNALQEGSSPEAARATANKQYYAFKAASPNAETSRNKYLTTANDYGRERISGAMPLAPTAGKTEAQAEIMGNKAKEAESFNAYNTSRERGTTAPLLGLVSDKAKIAAEGFNTILSDTKAATEPRALMMQSGLENETMPGVVRTTADATIAGNKQKSAEGNFRSTVIGQLNPSEAAQAEMAGYGAARDEAGLVSRTGGALKPGYGNPLVAPRGEFSDPLITIPGIMKLLQNAAPQTQAPAAASPSVLQNRNKVLFNLRSQGGKAQ